MLRAENFKVIARQGLGRSANMTARTMSVFKGALFVGTSGARVSSSDDAPRIWRYQPETECWSIAYEAPLIDWTPRADVPDLQVVKHIRGADPSRISPARRDGTRVPRDSGFRSMCVFQGIADSAPALYVTTMSRTGSVFLRSEDGSRFEQVGEPGLGNRDVYSYRGLTSFNGRLFASPAGTLTDTYFDRNLAPEALVYVTDDPSSGKWFRASEPGFGDPGNEAVYSLCAAHDRLYAATANPERGFQLWQTYAEGDPPYEWHPVILDGGGAFNHNLAAATMVEFKGQLYVGSGITGLGYHAVHDIGPASAELMRVRPDGTWDLIAGRVRFTPDGLKVPLSLLGPGFGDFYNSVIWSLGVHKGVIYLGTHQWEGIRAVQINANDVIGGYQIWGSTDGEKWIPVLEDGHGNPGQIGVRSLASTPFGFFVGTHNQSGLLELIARRQRRRLNLEPGFQVLLAK
jgi:hypothetical protein